MKSTGTTPTLIDLTREAQEQTLKTLEEIQKALPTPVQAVEASFAFAASALDIQKQYALRVAAALTP